MLTIKRLISALFTVFLVAHATAAISCSWDSDCYSGGTVTAYCYYGTCLSADQMVVCSAGYYVPEGSTECTPCGYESYCPGGRAPKSNDAAQLIPKYTCYSSDNPAYSSQPYSLAAALGIGMGMVRPNAGMYGCQVLANGNYGFDTLSLIKCDIDKCEISVDSSGNRCSSWADFPSGCKCQQQMKRVSYSPSYQNAVNFKWNSLPSDFYKVQGISGLSTTLIPKQSDDLTYSFWYNEKEYSGGSIPTTDLQCTDAKIFILPKKGIFFQFSYQLPRDSYVTVGTYPVFDGTEYTYTGSTDKYSVLQVSAPCAPIKFNAPSRGDNYIFTGWGPYYGRLAYDATGTPVDGCLYENTSLGPYYGDKLHDIWWERQYTIVEDIDGSTKEKLCLFSEGVDGNPNCSLSNPEKSGYSFQYWDVQGIRMQSDGTLQNVDIVEDGEPVMRPQPGKTFKTWVGDMTSAPVSERGIAVFATAQWTPNTYTITFNPENGEAETTETATFDAQYPTAPSVAKTGYTFVGWFDSVTGGTQYYTDDDATYTVADDLTLYAQWEPNTYTITFNPASGDGIDTGTVAFDGGLPQITPPARLGYKFLGYYDDETKYYDENGTAQFDAYTTPANVTLTAEWTPITYTITFNPENGGAATTETATFDAQYPTAPSVAKTGYTFVGWFDSVTGGTQYYTDDGATYAVADDLTLYAQWTPNSFTIIYNGNGATGEMPPTTCTYDQSCFVADNAFTKTDYKFAGWQMTDGTPVAVGADFTNKTAVANGNIILVAQWSLDTLDCQLGKYYNGTVFVKCPAGQYCSGTGTATVGTEGCGVECPAGYNAATGAESQEDCAIYVPAGSYLANARDAAPTDCPLGHHCPGDVIVNYGNTSEIYGCSMYGYADETGLAECKKCPDITKGALIEAAQNSRNDDGVRDSINDCAYAFMFAAPEYVDAWNMTPPDFYDTASPLNQRGFFTVICQYNSDTNDYDTDCYASFVSYCADGYYSPQSQDATTYADAQNVMYENINLKTLENLPCQPVESDLGFVSPGIDTDAPTSDTNFKSLQQQCKPADNEIGAAIAMTDSRYGFGGSEKTCAAVYQFAFLPGGEKYAPKPNIRGTYVTRCLYNKNTGEYDGGCQTNVIYCDSGYYATVKLSPDSGDITEEMILPTDTVEQAVDRACAPVGDGHYSPGQMQCLIEQNINPEETFVVPEFNQETQQCFMDIQNLGVEYISKIYDCPYGGSTDKETAYSIEQCFKSNVECSDGNGGTGVKKCYYNESDDKYNKDCDDECKITKCQPGKYMDNGCQNCPAGSYCTNNTKIECPENSNSDIGASECYCVRGYEKDANGNCVAKEYTVTYRVGNSYPRGYPIYGQPYTFKSDPYTKRGYTQTGWSVMMPTSLSDKVFGLGETFIYNVSDNMDLTPKYKVNEFPLVFQDGGADNAGEYEDRLPTGFVGTYGKPLPDIRSLESIELKLTDELTDAGQRYMVSDGWKFNDYYKAWNKDGTSTGNCPSWSDNCLLPIEPDGETVYVSPYWVTEKLMCNPGYFMPFGNVEDKSCTKCWTNHACPGWKEPQVVGKEYGMFKCPDNSTSNEQSAYCTCKTGFSVDGMENGETELYPTIEARFGDQSCKKITLYYNYDVNGGKGALEPTAVKYGETVGPISGEEIGAQMTRAGYVFVGWGETQNATEPYTDWQNAPMTSSKTLYAIWEQCKSGTYKDADAAAHVQCTPCPESHPNTELDASTDITQCYVECAERINVIGGVAFRDNETESYGAECTYSHGRDENGNECDVVDGVCVHTDCEPEYEMINGRCTPCARKYALSYNPNGNCRVESCIYGYHPNGDKCEGDTIECDAPNADNAQRVWNSATNSFGACVITKCSEGFHVDANACVSDTRVCKIENGIGEQLWDAKRNRWGDCVASRCEPGYTNDPNLTNERWKDCGRCNNMFGIDGDVAVSSYINECEIATCMYQGEKYILENNECRLICGDYTDETGHRYWDDEEYECKHDCYDGYLPW